MFLVSVVGSIEFLRHNSKEPWREAAQIFQKNYHQGDQVVYLPGYSEFAFSRYLPDSFDDLPVVAIGGRPSFFPRGSHRLRKETDTGINDVPSVNMQNQRLWLVIRRDATSRLLLTQQVQWLNTTFRKLKEWRLGSPDLILSNSS